MAEAAAGALVMTGALLMRGFPRAEVARCCAIGLAVALWGAVWFLLISGAVLFAEALGRWVARPAGPFLVSLSAALAGWLIAVAAARALIPARLRRVGPVPASAFLTSLGWAGALIITQLGRSGQWPAASLALAAVVVLLALLLAPASRL